MAHKHVTATGYLLTYLALLTLATGSLLLSFLPWVVGQLVTSLAIAVVKAVLVLWFFMHLYEQRFANRMVVLVSVLLVVLLVVLSSLDVATRHTFPKALRPSPSNSFYQR